MKEARSRRAREIQMWSIIRDILSYLCFLWTIYVITYSTRHSNASHQVKHLRQLFLNIDRPQHDYTKVSVLLLFKSSFKNFDIARFYQ